MRSTRVSLALLFGCLLPLGVGCDASTEQSSDRADEGDPLTRPSVYYRVRTGKGESGNKGVLVRRLNKAPTTCPEPGTSKAVCFVGELDLSRLELPQRGIDAAEESIRQGLAIVRGRLRSELEPKTTLVVEEFWHTLELPGFENDGGPTFSGDLALEKGTVAYRLHTEGDELFELIAQPVNLDDEVVLGGVDASGAPTLGAPEELDTKLREGTPVLAVGAKVEDGDTLAVDLLYTLLKEIPSAAE